MNPWCGFICPLLSAADWHVGLDPDWRHRLLPPVNSLLGDVCVHPALDSDHLPVHNLSHRSPQQDTADPLDDAGNPHTPNTHPRPHTHTVWLSKSTESVPLWRFICELTSLCLPPLVAVFQLRCCCSVSGDSRGRGCLCGPGHQGATQLQLLGSISSKRTNVNASSFSLCFVVK